MALTGNVIRDTQRPESINPRNVNVAAAQTIYQGAILAMDATGVAVVALATQLLPYLGIATEAYTSVLLTTDTPLMVETGQQDEFTFDGAITAASVGLAVYYKDDGTVTLTKPGVATTRMGTLHSVTTSPKGMVNTLYSREVQQV